MTTAAQVEDIAGWIDMATAASAETLATAQEEIGALWAGFAGWYVAAEVAELARPSAALSLEAQQILAGLFAEYVSQVTAVLRPGTAPTIRTVPTPDIRGGVDLAEVYVRPAIEYKETVAFTADFERAEAQALQKIDSLVEDDLMLAVRDAVDDSLFQLDWQRYRRVLRPEMSESGPCGLCVVAADQIYSVGDLLPLHSRCKCTVVPVEDGDEAARRLNRADLDRLYAAAGSSSARDLNRLRVTVGDGGELGPILQTRTPRDITAPPRAQGTPTSGADMLARLNAAYDRLRADRTAPTEALAYQRGRIRTASRAA